MMKFHPWIASAAAMAALSPAAALLSAAPVYAQQAAAAPATVASVAAMPDAATYEAIKKYDFLDRTAIDTVKAAIRASFGNPAALASIERLLIPVLDDPASTLGAKQQVCKMLWEIGTAQSVPAVSRMLTDPKLTNDARFALERNEDPSAGRALRDALGKTQGGVLVGIINSIGNRRDPEAVGVLTPFTRNADNLVSGAAILALGKIGTPDAVTVLNALTPRTLLVDQALTEAAKQLRRMNHAQESMAVYRSVLDNPNSPQPARIAAAEATLAANPARAVPQMLVYLQGNDLDLRGVAAHFVRDLPPNANLTPLVAGLDGLPPESQALLVGALSVRGDASVLPILMKGAVSTNASIREAALRGMGELPGNAAATLLLARTAAHPGDDPAAGDAARFSLTTIRGAAVDQALIGAAPTADPETRTEIFQALKSRGTRSALPMLFQLAARPDPDVSAAATSTLAALAGPRDYPQTVGLIVNARSEGARTAAETAVISVSRQVPDADRTAPLVAALHGANTTTQASLLKVLGVLGGPDAIAAIRTAMKSTDPQLQDAAFRALAGARDPSAGPDLLAIAQNAPNQTRQVLALRGYVQLAALPALDPDTRVQMLQNALAAAKRLEEKRLVLSGLGDVPDEAALKAAMTYLDDPALRDDAAAAAVKIARAAGGAAGPDVKADMRRVMQVSTDADVKAGAQAVIATADVVLRGWRILGPFAMAANEFDRDFGPEKALNLNATYKGADGDLIRWKPAIIKPNGYVDLNAQMNPHENVAAYALVYVKSPDDRKALLSAGSDDGLKAWVNGDQVVSDNATRPASPGQDQKEVNLKAGWNTVLLKITQTAGDWGYYFDLLDDNKAPMGDLVYSASPQ